MRVIRRNLLIKYLTVRKLLPVVLCSSVLLFYEFLIYSHSITFDHLHEGSIFVNTDSYEIFTLNKNIVNLYYKERQSWRTSNLGSILFKNIPKETFQNSNSKNKTFVVLIWKHWKWLQARHVHSFNNTGQSDPLSQCSVKNCIFTGNDSLLDTADAVVVHIQKGQFPRQGNRKQSQKWIFLNDESPKNAFSMSSNKPLLSNLANVFNWSMTYRSDADVPVPYGRTVPLTKVSANSMVHGNVLDVVPDWNKKRGDVLAAILISNCAVAYRMKYLNELKKHMNVDIHGKCSVDKKMSCPGHFKSDCQLMSKYLFYLVFENSMCKEYLTEKVFYHAYSKGAIPVILGPSIDDCKKLLPPHSYLHVENFETPSDLANKMKIISDNEEIILSYHQWRKYFKVLNEHGYFGLKSFHFCRICEALNYNDGEKKSYDENDLKEFLDPLKSCYKIDQLSNI